jgi:hypothetical protein
MPEQMAVGLNQLKYAGLDPRKQTEYIKEVEAVDTYVNELDRIAAKSEKEGFDRGKEEGELKGRLEGLMKNFIKGIKIDGEDFEEIRVDFLSKSFVGQVWGGLKNANKTEEKYGKFLQELENKGLMAE